MKKLVLAIAALSLISFASVTEVSAKEKTTTTTSPGSFSAGPFGCWGSGFCTTTTTTSSIITNNGNGTVTVDFDYSTFNEKNAEFYKGKTVYSNDKETKMSEQDCRALGLPVGTVFMPGQFPIRWNNDRMVITVPVQ